MVRIEELVRDSLHARAADVEPTPALWQEVERRVGRRRRSLVAAWSLAGAGTIAVVAIVVPAVLGVLGPARAPDVVPVDRAPAGAAVPTHAAVVHPDGLVRVLDLHSGATGDVGGFEDATVVDLTVGPAAVPDADTPGIVAATSGPDGARIVRWSPAGGGQTWYHDDDPALVTSAAVAPDRGHLAVLTPGDGDRVNVSVSPDALEEDVPASPAELADVADVEAGSRLLEWVGAAEGPGDGGALWIRRPDGTVVAQTIALDDGGDLVAGDTTPLFDGTPVLDAGAADPAEAGGPDVTAPVYLLREGADGPELVWSDDGGATATVTVPLGRMLDDDADRLWLDAAFDAALVGDGTRALLVTHDGSGDFGPPAALDGDVVRAALLPATVGAPAPPSGDADGTAGIAEALVLADERHVDLVGADGRRRLVDLPAEGESTVVDVAVRPGSTTDDLTALLLTRAEGLYDLRRLRVVDGEVTAFEVLDPPHGPGSTPAPDHPDPAPPAPVWAPDGDAYAWIQATEDGADLHTAGWDDTPGARGPADDATFALEGVPDQGVRLQDWVAVGDDLHLRLVHAGADGGRSHLVVRQQSDGALALPYGNTPVRSADDEPGTSVHGVAGLTEADALAWAYVRTPDGEDQLVHAPHTDPTVVELPDDVAADDVPTPRLRTTTDGGVVLTVADRAFHVDTDGDVVRLGAATSAAPVP